jgi:hypothetical protein
MHLAYHANVTMRGAARISGRVIFIAGFSMCALLVNILGIAVARSSTGGEHGLALAASELVPRPCC